MATEHADNAQHAQQVLTPSSYIEHHLTFNAKSLGEGGFWTLHVDTFVMSVALGLLVMGLVWLVARKATAGVPTKGQAFVELVFGFIDDQVKNIFHGNRHSFIAPTALTVFLWVFAMNSMDFLPVDWVAGIVSFFGGEHATWRAVPTSDINTTFALALAVWILMIFFSIKVKGLGGWVHELFYAPFGGAKFFKPKSAMGFIGLLLSPLLFVANFAFNLIEYISKPLSHALRLFGNMYAGEVIFLLLGMWAATGAGWIIPSAILGAGWSIFHILIVALQAFIFMMLTVVYLAMAHESH
ncbi:MAG: F0F1 ATP synthase subunit A [Methylotenera sp.]|nr:F0F1 ATP synthase subunit A [Methylotenera sp.]MDO9233367.1 F0F1 ATP synthase subunit A [Methylotenera sp.]MDO9388943.1 F0F1 ATP synthase subunit A [Methylotenera sp.]MDP1595726.1 F0F1 ATP synthase subunit A [Methylotenera sp.]MDP1755649.1 F0F1 ATP synthase subunit A [Methylotenera sp.]